MARPIVYVTLQQFCEHDDRPLRLLEDAGCEVRRNTLGRRMRREDLLGALKDAEAVMAGVEPYDAGLLSSLTRLRCISRCGTGTDAIDLDAARARGITIHTTPDEVVEPVAQLTVAMILALARNLHLHHEEMRGGAWKKHTGALLSEWTIGLVGFGRIGRAVERCLRPFGARLLIADPKARREEIPETVELRDLPSLLSEADLVSIHATGAKNDPPLIGRRELDQMKPGSRLVNTARGSIVDEAALVDALRSGRLYGAAVDVFADEPYAGPLTALPQVICTPHIATLTRASRAAMEWRCAQHVVDHFDSTRVGSSTRSRETTVSS